MPSQEEYLDQLLKGLTEEPVEELPIEEPVIEEPVIEEPVIEEPVIEDLIIEEPVAEEEIVEEPMRQEPVFDATEDGFDGIKFDKVEFDSFQMNAMDDNAGEDTDILRKMLLENATLEEVMREDEEDSSEIMSEEEIDRILQANQDAAEDVMRNISESEQDEDLMQLLGEASDGELQDIYEMLHKSDNNEVIDEEMMALLHDDGISEADRLQALLDGEDVGDNQEESALSEREKKAREKKRLKEVKAAAKQAAKEAKKAEKEAKKAAKKASKDIAKENAEAAAAPITTAEEDMFASLDELSTADMLDLQDLLAFADVQSPSQDAIAQLQQDAKAQTKPVMRDVPDSQVSTIDLNEPTEADMQEIDELLSLAGITNLDDDATIAFEPVDDSGAVVLFDENDIPEKIENNASGKEKKGLFAKILDLLTETDEDGTEDIPLSDENRTILEEMDREEKAGKKGKKGKKDKKNKRAQTELGTLDDDEAAAPKNKKATKAKKPKKDKKVKHLEVKPLEDSKNKLPLKVMVATGALCATVLVLILLLVNLGGDFAVKREAKQAYYQEDYETCYQALYGKELNESEQVMFAKSESILRIRVRMRQYEMFVEEQSEVEALDVLIQTVYDYEDLYAYASKWNAGNEVSATYGQMLSILQDKYKLSEDEALEIASEPYDVEYTKLVTAVAEGKGYHSSQNESKEPVTLPDMLPEEMDFPENNGGR